MLFAVYQGEIGVGIDIGALGLAYFSPTTVVPAPLVAHALMFQLLLRTEMYGSRPLGAAMKEDD